MVATLNHPEPARQANQKSHDELQRDLNPNHMAGQNIEGGPATLGPSVEPALEIDDPTRQLQGPTSTDPGRARAYLSVPGRCKMPSTSTWQARSGARSGSPRRRSRGRDSTWCTNPGAPHMDWNRLVRVSDPQRLP